MSIKETFIEITNKCFLACKHCSTEAKMINNDIIDISTLRRVVNESKELGVHTITLSGGEPLTHPDIKEIIFHASNSSMHVRMYSCGVLASDYELSSIDMGTFNTLKESGLETLIFSLHGTPEVHDYITGVEGSFKLVIDSIRNANQIGINIEIHMVPMKVNYRDIVFVLNEADNLNVNRVSLLRYVPQGRLRYNPHLEMSKDEHVEFLNIISSIDTSKVRLGAPYSCLLTERYNTCSAGKNKILIGPNGDVYPCEAFKSALKNKTSNIYKASLIDIWEKDKMLNEIRTLNVKNVSTCSECDFIESCKAGCHGQRYFVNSSLQVGPDPICLMQNSR